MIELSATDTTWSHGCKFLRGDEFFHFATREADQEGNFIEVEDFLVRQVFWDHLLHRLLVIVHQCPCSGVETVNSIGNLGAFVPTLALVVLPAKPTITFRDR